MELSEVHDFHMKSKKGYDMAEVLADFGTKVYELNRDFFESEELIELEHLTQRSNYESIKLNGLHPRITTQPDTFYASMVHVIYLSNSAEKMFEDEGWDPEEVIVVVVKVRKCDLVIDPECYFSQKPKRLEEYDLNAFMYFGEELHPNDISFREIKVN